MERSVLSLESKLRVAWVDFYSVRVFHAWIVDNQDRGVEVCIDLRQDSPTRNRLFEGGRHPRKSGATLIELGSEQEGIIIPLLSRYLDSDEARKQLTEYGFELFQDALIRYGDVDATVLGTDAAND